MCVERQRKKLTDRQTGGKAESLTDRLVVRQTDTDQEKRDRIKEVNVQHEQKYLVQYEII